LFASVREMSPIGLQPIAAIQPSRAMLDSAASTLRGQPYLYRIGMALSGFWLIACYH
jgi:hypothetical protein